MSEKILNMNEVMEVLLNGGKIQGTMWKKDEYLYLENGRLKSKTKSSNMSFTLSDSARYIELKEPKPKKVYKARWFVDSADGTFACIEDGYEKEFIADAFEGEAIEVKPINAELTEFEEVRL